MTMIRQRTDDGDSAAAVAAVLDRGCGPSSTDGVLRRMTDAAADHPAGYAAADDGFAVDGDAKTDDASTCSSSLDDCF